MSGMSKLIPALVVVATTLLRFASAHTVISYPGWRGNNIITNGTLPEANPDSIGIDHYNNGTTGFPYGMQFMFPCGGLPMSTNRTKWPVGGGAVAFQPGWSSGHQTAYIYINIGLTVPPALAPANYSNVAIPVFQITGPNNTQYPGTFCMPQVPMPTGMSFNIGDNVTIQVIETTQSGAALYSCVDVTLADPTEVDEVTPQNCFNSTDIAFNLVFSTQALSSNARSVLSPSTIYSIIAVAMTVAAYVLS